MQLFCWHFSLSRLFRKHFQTVAEDICFCAALVWTARWICLWRCAIQIYVSSSSLSSSKPCCYMCPEKIPVSFTYNKTHIRLPITVCRNVLISCCHQCRICVIDYLRLIIFLNVIAPRSVMYSFMFICQCCFAIVKVLLKKVTYLHTLCAAISWATVC